MARRQFKVPFAATGDVVSIPEAVQPDGSVSMTQGYGFDYQRDPATDPLAKVFPRDVHNGLLNEITASIGEIQQQGYPIWTVDGAPYPINAVVRHSDKNWISTISNNSDEPGVGAGATSWKITGAVYGQNFVVFSTPGVASWAVPDILKDGTVKARVTVVGGGGGGGSATSSANYNAAGGGGGGGGYAEKLVDLTGVSSVSVTVGAGGNGGVSPATVGTAGGTSSFGAYASATGGSPGNNAVAVSTSTQIGAGGQGGSGTGGDLNGRGHGGQAGVAASPTVSGSSVGPGYGGGTAVSGGVALGGGGNGSATTTGSQSVNGNAGSAGVVIIRW